MKSRSIVVALAVVGGVLWAFGGARPSAALPGGGCGEKCVDEVRMCDDWCIDSECERTGAACQLCTGSCRACLCFEAPQIFIEVCSCRDSSWDPGCREVCE